MKKVAVVTGAYRGLGLETSRQLAQKGYTVVLTSRDIKKSEAAAEKLKKENLIVIPFQVDVTSQSDVDRLKAFLEKEFGRVDVLVNNAGILPDTKHLKDFPSAFTSSVETLKAAAETNVYGPFRLSQALIPLMKKNHYGRVVNVSSGMGQLSDMNGGYPAYRISKTALNAITKIFSEEADDAGVLINSVCPGWVKTDMGGAEAERELPKGAETIVWLATLPEGGPTGGFFRDKEPIPW